MEAHSEGVVRRGREGVVGVDEMADVPTGVGRVPFEERE
ncbi:hypothetical protein B005_3444 [Nocardiopsis alba ATCC BAA-2165]|uniref:Uncharacterized protein n=1 Tax=Nocardiopsis alba (strain ATCC BAA-2165 / BE74) TaxID=1205910 RepID=J7L824_NOCAA|nr:hypothetical protein B005_3444 [Nocardiopsis alba ATCC BAA-2165]